MTLSRRHFLAGTAALGTGAIALNSTVGLEDSELPEQFSVDDIHKRQAKIQSRQNSTGALTASEESTLAPRTFNIPQGSNHSRLDAANNLIIISPAQVLAEKEIVISAGIQGKLTRLRINGIEVKEGQHVTKDQEIGTIDDSVELKQIAAAEALLGVAKAEEEKVIEIEYAKAAWTVAYSVVERNKQANLLTPNTITPAQVLEDELKRTQARKQYEKAVYDLNIIRPAETKVKEQELAIAETKMGQRRLISSVDGIVDEIWGHEGMWFREGEKILKITQYDTLKVKGKVNIQHATPRMIDGKTVDVIAEPLGNELPLQFKGKVTFASQTIEGDGHFNILVEVKNELKDGYWLLNPGRFVELRIKL